MKKNFILLLVLAITGIANGQSTFRKAYGGASPLTNTCYVVATADGGFALLATTNNLGAGSNDIYLVRTDGDGNLLWTKTYGGSNIDQAFAIANVSDGGFIITGSTVSFGSGGRDVYLIRTDANGDTLWTRTFGQATSDEDGLSVQQTSDGGFIVAGDRDGSFAYLIRTSSAGDTLWTKAYDSGRAVSVQQKQKGGFIIAGYSFTGMFLLNTDSSGNVIWDNTYSGPYNQFGYFVLRTTDGGYLLGGSGVVSIHNNQYIVKTDSNGAVLWSKTYGDGTFELYCTAALQLSDGYLLLGHLVVYSFAARLTRVDLAGNVLWAKNLVLGATGALAQTADGGFAVSFNAGGGIYLVKTDSNGNDNCMNLDASTEDSSIVTTAIPVTPNNFSGTIVNSTHTQVGSGGTESAVCMNTGVESLSNEATAISIYPDPASNQFFIGMNSNAADAIVTIYNSLGRKLLDEKINPAGNTAIDIGNFQRGIYLVSISVDRKIFSQKIIVIK